MRESEALLPQVALSYWHYALSGEKQRVSVPLHTFKQFPFIWAAFRTAVSTRWLSFYRFWLTRASQSKAPLLILRFEELSRHEREGSVSSQLYSFLYSDDSFAGSIEPLSERTMLAEYLRRSSEFKTGAHRVECIHKGYFSPAETFSTNMSSLYVITGKSRADNEGSHKTRHRSSPLHELQEAFSEADIVKFRSGLRLELCLLGYGAGVVEGEGGWIGNEVLQCTEEESHALARGKAHVLIAAAAAAQSREKHVGDESAPEGRRTKEGWISSERDDGGGVGRRLSGAVGGMNETGGASRHSRSKGGERKGTSFRGPGPKPWEIALPEGQGISLNRGSGCRRTRDGER